MPLANDASNFVAEAGYLIGKARLKVQGKRNDDERLQAIIQAIPFLERPLTG